MYEWHDAFKEDLRKINYWSHCCCRCCPVGSQVSVSFFVDTMKFTAIGHISLKTILSNKFQIIIFFRSYLRRRIKSSLIIFFWKM